MERKHNFKRIVAWLLTAAMVFGNSSFVALAEEAAPETAAIAEEAVSETAAAAEDTAAVEDAAVAEDTAIAEEGSEPAPEEDAAAEEDILVEDETTAPDEEAGADVPVETEASAEELLPEAEGILLESMEVMPEGFELTPIEEGEEEGPRYDVLALSWTDYGNGGDETDEDGNLLNPECVYDGTWVFPGRTVTLNVEGLDQLADMELGKYDLRVRTYFYDPETEEETDAAEYLTAELSEDQQSITVTGHQATNDQQSIVEIQAFDESGNLAAVGGTGVSVIEEVEDCWFELDPYQNAVFPNDWYWLNRVHYQIQTPEHPYWTEDTTEIEAVDITRQYTLDEEGNEIETDGIVADSRANEYGDWYLQMGESCGCVEYTAHFTLPIGENGKECELSGEVYVGGDVWGLNFEYPNYEDDSMLPGETMTIHTTLSHEWRHGDDWGYEEPEDYELSISEDQDFGTLEVSVDGRDIIVKAGDDWCWCALEAVAMIDGKEVARHDFSVNVQAEGYFLLRVDNMDEVNNLAPNASVTIDPELVFISPEGGEVVQEDVKYCLEFDQNILSAVDASGKELSDGSGDREAGMGAAPLTITKKATNDGTDAQLLAMMKDENGDYVDERYRLNLHFWEQDYSVRYEFDGADEYGYNWGVPIFTDEDKVVTADTSRLQEMGVDYEIVWKVGLIEDGDWQILEPLPADGGYYTAEGDKITLHGAKLAEVYPPFNGEGEENCHFDLRAQVLVNGIPVWENDGPGLEMREPYGGVDLPLGGVGDNETFPNGTIQFGARTGYYICNAAYPDGVELSATITDVKIIRNVMWAEDGEVESEEPLFTVEYSAEDGWTLTAGEVCGYAYLEFTYEVRPDPNSPEKIVGTYGSADDESDECFMVFVTGEKQYLELVDVEEEILLNSGEDKTISTKAWREYMDEEGNPQTEEISGYELRFTEGEETFYDPEMIEVEDNGDGSFTIRPQEDHIGWVTNMRIQCWVQMEGDEEPWQWGGDLWQSVRIGCPEGAHGQGEWKVTVVPTCTEAGMQTLYCENCGYELGAKEIEATGHTEKEELTKAPTCTAPGEKTFTCEICGEVLRTESVEATGHTAGKAEITKTATCTAKGEKTTKCTVCGEVLSREEIPMTGHTAGPEETTKAASCTAEGEKTVKCTVCGAVMSTTKIPVTGHSWGAWSAPTEATINAASTKTRTCTVCKSQEVQTVSGKLTPVLKLTANSLKMKTKQTTKKFLVTEIANGDSVVSVESSNTKVLKVKSFNSKTGTFTLAAQKKKGNADLTITLASGIFKKVKVTVQTAKVQTTKLTVDKSSKKITLKKGKKYTLKPVVAPVTSQDKLSYTSSDKKVATVSSKGVITAKKKGKAKITIKSGKKKVVCTVTVK